MGLDSVELIMEVEAYFEIEITAEEAEQIETIGDFHQRIISNLKKKDYFKSNIPYLSDAEVFDLLKKLIHEKMGVPLRKITQDAKIVRDLGLD